MLPTYQSALEQAFELQLPESFQKKLLTSMIGEELADQKMINKLISTWVQMERAEEKALKAFFVFLKEQAMEKDMVLNFSMLENELFDDLQALMDEYNELLEEYNLLAEQWQADAQGMEDLNNALMDSLDALFPDEDSENTDKYQFAQNYVKASKAEQLQYIELINQHIEKEAEAYALNYETEPSKEFNFVDFDAHLKQRLNTAPELKDLRRSSIQKGQITEKIIGKEGDKHNDLHHKKFQLACHKAICLNRLKSSAVKLQDIASSADSKLKCHHQPPRVSF